MIFTRGVFLSISIETACIFGRNFNNSCLLHRKRNNAENATFVSFGAETETVISLDLYSHMPIAQWS